MTRFNSRQPLWQGLVLSIALAFTVAGTALAASPVSEPTTTGQDLRVELTVDPAADGAIWAGTSVQATARATIDSPHGNVVYVLDVSGSMEDPSLNPYQDLAAPVGLGAEDDCNGDGVYGSALDAACIGLIALNQSLGSDPDIEIGMIAFGEGAKIADMDPDQGSQPFTSPPDVDHDSSGSPDAEQVIRSTDTENTATANAGIGQFTADYSAGFGGATNYDAALTAVNSLLSSQPPSERNRAVFISDGLPIVFTAGPGSPLDSVDPSTIVDTFAIGAYASGACSDGQPLAKIASATGGTCTEVADPSALSAVLPVQSTDIVSLQLQVDGEAADSTAGANSTMLSLTDVDITDFLEPGANLVSAIATTADGTEAVADVEIQVVDLRLTPDHHVHDLSIENSHTVTATLLGSPSVIAGRMMTFEVTGQNPTGPSAVNANGTGVADYTYSVPVELGSLGLDTISATVVIDGVPGMRTVTAEWIDATPPEAACLETHNPTGRNVPQSPGRGGQAQNPDGFYELSGDDEPFGSSQLELYLVDDGSGAVFGPFAVGTTIKYTQADGTEPRLRPMAGNNGTGGHAVSVDYHIWGNGDGSLVAFDLSSNQSEPAACLVPRPPK